MDESWNGGITGSGEVLFDVLAGGISVGVSHKGPGGHTAIEQFSRLMACWNEWRKWDRHAHRCACLSAPRRCILDTTKSSVNADRNF